MGFSGLNDPAFGWTICYNMQLPGNKKSRRKNAGFMFLLFYKILFTKQRREGVVMIFLFCKNLFEEQAGG